MLSVADYHFFDFFERAGIHKDAAGRHGIPPTCSFLSKVDGLSILQQKDFFGDSAKLMRQGRVPKEVSILAMDRNEIFRLHKLQN